MSKIHNSTLIYVTKNGFGQTPGEVAAKRHTEQMGAGPIHKVNQHPTILIESSQIQKRILSLAFIINRDYKNKKITIVCVLKGAVLFCSDLIQQLDNVELDFIQCRSYTKSKSNKNPLISTAPTINLRNKHVLIVEDIADTGLSLNLIQHYIELKKPRTLQTCVLLDKPSKREVKVNLDYVGFPIPDLFVVGYGMDYMEKYRNLPNICVYKNE